MSHEALGDTLALVNATLNGTSAVLLVAGRVAIGKKSVKAHRAFMTTAFGTSSLFLASYLTRVYLTGTHKYPGDGPIRVVYYVVLGTHMILAVAVVPMVLRALFLATKKRFPEHRKIARYTVPVWLYVSVTGVLVYLMLYRIIA